MNLALRFLSRFQSKLLQLISILVLGLLLMGASTTSQTTSDWQTLPTSSMLTTEQPSSSTTFWGSLQAQQSGGIGAIIMSIVTILLLLVAVLLFELMRLIYDKPLIKRVLDGQVLLTQIFPFFARKTESSTLSEPEQVALKGAMTELVPAEWATQQTENALEAVYSFVENKEQDYPALAIELGPLLSALKGKPGRRAIRELVNGLPNCPGRRFTPKPGFLGLPECIPPQMKRSQLTGQIQKSISKQLKNSLRHFGKNPVIGVEELQQMLPQPAGDQARDIPKSFQELRTSLVRMLYLSWGLWLIALITLGLTVYLANPFSNAVIATWLGWPLLIAGIIVLTISLVMQWRQKRQINDSVRAAAIAEWLSEPLGLWHWRIRIWSGGLATVGIVSVVVGNVI
jgi:hypothetical protein